MALSSTVRTVVIDLSDVDRGVYESLELKVAQHPSESEAYLATRLLAFALEHDDGLAFTQGLGATDQPPIWQRDLTGRLLAWVDVGTPSGDRLHKASKAADRVAVYCHKRVEPWLRALQGSTVHRAEQIAIYAVPLSEMTRLGQALDRRNHWQLTRTEGTIYLDTEGLSLVFALPTVAWPVSSK